MSVEGRDWLVGSKGQITCRKVATIEDTIRVDDHQGCPPFEHVTLIRLATCSLVHAMHNASQVLPRCLQ